MAVESAAVTYQFGEFEVDVLAYELRHRGERVRLSRQPMDLLLLLLERPHELVSREEIARRLWAAVPEIRWIRARYIDPVRTVLGAERFESARAEGRTMALGDAITLARQRALLLG